MSLPDVLSLSRVPFLFLIAAALSVPGPPQGLAILAFLLFVVAALTDWLDGLVARQQGTVSDYGKLMDALTDKILMVGLFVTFLATGLLPGWTLLFLLLILAREFLITGLRMLAAVRQVVLAAEGAGKLKMVLQVVSAGLLLLGAALPAAAGLFSVLGIIAFVAAALLTAYSGGLYLWKYRGLLLRAGEAA